MRKAQDLNLEQIEEHFIERIRFLRLIVLYSYIEDSKNEEC
jgi:hypothetical protein